MTGETKGTRRNVLAGGAAAVAAWSVSGLVARAQDATPGATPAAGPNPALSGSFVTVSHYRLKEGADPAALVAKVRDNFLPIVTAIPGFWEYRLAIAEDGVITTIRVFQTQEGADEGAAKGQEWSEADLDDLSELPAFMVTNARLEVDADGY